ncbi:MAG: hypothetical protein ACYSSP_13185 [Planctomycetota bacterium]|jgi:hypothetical protein
MERTFNPDTGVRNEKFLNMHTYRDLLTNLQLLDEEQLDMDIIHYDEESDIFWTRLDFIISKEEIVKDDIEIEENQPLFFLPR